MTTIAWDGKILATDGLMCADGMIMRTDTNKILVGDSQICSGLGGKILALASSGYPDTNECLYKWLILFYGIDSAWQGGKSFSAIVIKESKDAVLVTKEDDDPHISITPLTGVYAIGHGRDFAMGALLAGASADVAISVTSQLDPYTGGTPTSFKP